MSAEEAKKAHGRLFQLEGRNALVTGAGRGLGAAMAEALGRAGAHVIVNDIDAGFAETERARLSEAGLSAEAIAFDVADAAAVAAAIEAIGAVHGRLDVLVNNAGIAVYGGAEELEPADWKSVIDVDLTSVFLLSRQACTLLSRGGHGRIINIASVLSFQGGVRVPGYAAAKHAVVGLTKALANEWAASGVAGTGSR